MSACAHACVRECGRACVRACVRACLRACVYGCKIWRCHSFFQFSDDCYYIQQNLFILLVPNSISENKLTMFLPNRRFRGSKAI